MAVQFDCPSCGASIRYRGSSESADCKYCGSSVIVPPELRGTVSAGGGTTIETTGCAKGAGILAVVGALLVMGIAGFVFFIARSVNEDGVGGSAVQLFSNGSAGSIELEFGGTGSGRGYFQDPKCIAIDGSGRIYVGEWESGRVQVFDTRGEFIDQWSYASPGDCYLMAMSADRDGTLYAVYDSEIKIHDGLTGDLQGTLRHPEGWGFEDVDVAQDGSVLASWYCNRDDIVMFNSSGGIELLIPEAISGVTGETELSTKVAAGNSGEIYAFGSFNGRVLLFDADGSYVDRFGSEDMFIMPSGMDVDPAGRLWISDFGDLLVFDTSGELVRRMSFGQGIEDFVIDDDFRLWGISYDDRIVMIDVSTL